MFPQLSHGEGVLDPDFFEFSIYILCIFYSVMFSEECMHEI